METRPRLETQAARQAPRVRAGIPIPLFTGAFLHCQHRHCTWNYVGDTVKAGKALTVHEALMHAGKRALPTVGTRAQALS